MSLDFTTLDARARGLATRLFSREDLDALAASADLPSLARALGRSPKLLAPLATGELAEVERAVRRTSARHLATLRRWAGERDAGLAVFYAEQDRRALRALLRGALQGAPTESKLAGLIATPTLPERALSELARQPTAAKVVAHLFALRHPDAERLLPLTAQAHPVLFELELALVRGYAERAVQAARRGDANLRELVARRVDLANLELALMLASGPHDADPEQSFVEGGAHLSRAAFVSAAAMEPPLAADALRAALAQTPLAHLGQHLADPVQLERAALLQLLALQRDAALRDPLGSAPLLHFLLRLELQQRDLARLTWGAALGAPASVLRKELATPWS